MEECNEEQNGVVSANQETAAAAGAASRSTKRKAIGSADVENVAKRHFEKPAARAIQAHTPRAVRDSRRDGIPGEIGPGPRPRTTLGHLPPLLKAIRGQVSRQWVSGPLPAPTRVSPAPTTEYEQHHQNDQ